MHDFRLVHVFNCGVMKVKVSLASHAVIPNAYTSAEYPGT